MNSEVPHQRLVDETSQQASTSVEQIEQTGAPSVQQTEAPACASRCPFSRFGSGGQCCHNNGVLPTLLEALDHKNPRLFRRFFSMSVSLTVILSMIWATWSNYTYPWFFPISALLFLISWIILVRGSAKLADYKCYLIHAGIFTFINTVVFTGYLTVKTYGYYYRPAFPFHLIVLCLTSIAFALHTQKRFAKNFTALSAHCTIVSFANYMFYMIWAFTQRSCALFVAPLVISIVSLLIHGLIIAKRSGKLSAFMARFSSPQAAVLPTTIPAQQQQMPMMPMAPNQAYYIIDPSTGMATLVQPGNFPQYPMLHQQPQAQPMPQQPFQPLYPSMYPAPQQFVPMQQQQQPQSAPQQ